MTAPSILALERATMIAWPARERAEINGWTLQADTGITGRVNAASPLTFSGADANQTLTETEAWYAARNMPPHFKLTEGATEPAHLADLLAARGYEKHTPTLLMARALPLGHETSDARIAATPDAIFAAVFQVSSTSEADLNERTAIVARAPQPRAFATLMLADAPAAIGMCVVVDGLAGIFAMRTAPNARRQGLARRILASLLEWAHANGAAHAYLQVEAPNVPAIALYERAGFTTRARYDYWRKAP